MTNARPEERKTKAPHCCGKKIGHSKESNDQQDQKRIHFIVSNCCEDNVVVVVPIPFSDWSLQFSNDWQISQLWRSWKPKSCKIKGCCQPLLRLTLQISTLNPFVDQHLWGNCKEVLTGIFGSQNKGYQFLTEQSGDLPLGILSGACCSAFSISYSDLDLVSV